MSGGLWYYNEDGTECDELNRGLHVGIDFTEEELDQLTDEAMKADPSLPITPNMAEDPENDPII